MFSGKVILITGASSGIGAAAAIHFAKEDAILSLTGRNLGKLEEVYDECVRTRSSCKPLLIKADITKDENVRNVLETTIKTHGKLNVLINNAGILENGSIENTDIGQYDRVFNTNVRSIYLLTSLAVPYLVATKGNIVNVSSVNGIRSFPGVLAYNMSKSALDQFTKCIALELAPKQVRVNSVNPGLIITEIHKRAGMTEEQYEQFLARTKFTHALGRPGLPSEAVEAIAFLASDQASFITAATLPVDGGRHAMCPR